MGILANIRKSGGLCDESEFRLASSEQQSQPPGHNPSATDLPAAQVTTTVAYLSDLQRGLDFILAPLYLPCSAAASDSIDRRTPL